jgi:hypothetical protein
LKSLLGTEAFRSAIQQVLAEEMEPAMAAMRTCVRANSLVEAARAEGGITALEDLLGTLDRYASRAED